MHPELHFLDTELRMPGMKLPVRTVLVDVPQGRVAFSPGSQLRLEAWTYEVTDLVAPNLLHTGGVMPASKVFPKARRWAPPGGIANKPQVQWNEELDPQIAGMGWAYNDVLEPHFIAGMPKANEVVFIHRPSRSLIVADLCFNILQPKGWMAPIFLSLFGTYKQFGVSRFYCGYIQDEKAFHASVRELMLRDFDSIICSHGEVVLKNGKSLLREAFANRGFDC